MYREITLQLTDLCTLHCPYCFAGNDVPKTQGRFLTMEDATQFLKFCEDNEIDLIRITGGEPFVHPQWKKILSDLSSFDLNIFTNLTIENCIRDLKPEAGRVGFLVNINQQSDYTNVQWLSVLENLAELKARNITTVLGYNIYQKDFDLTTLFSLAKWMESRSLRLSIANPSACSNNAYLPLEDIRVVGRKLVSIQKQLEMQNIECHLDCPVAPCLMEETDYRYLYEKGVIRNQCSPMVFFKTDLHLSHCYATDSMEQQPTLEACNNDYLCIQREANVMFAKLNQNTQRWKVCEVCRNPFRAPEVCGCFAMYQREPDGVFI